MKWDSWMGADERTPEQKRRDRISNLRHEERQLEDRLKAVRERIAELEPAL